MPLISLQLGFCLFPLRYNNGRFFLLVDGPEPVTPWKMTRNQDLNVLHVDSAAKWADSLKALRRVTGDTLVFDFVYFLHPVSVVVPWSLVSWPWGTCHQHVVCLLHAAIAACSHGSPRGNALVIWLANLWHDKCHGCLAFDPTHLAAVVSALLLARCLPGCLMLCYAAMTL